MKNKFYFKLPLVLFLSMVIGKDAFTLMVKGTQFRSISIPPAHLNAMLNIQVPNSKYKKVPTM